jgi:flavin reductase
MTDNNSPSTHSNNSSAADSLTAESLNSADVKAAFSRIGKSIAVITLADDDGRHATISSAFMNLTQQPPSILLALEKSSSLYARFSDKRTFAINVLGDGHQGVVDACAREKGEARFQVGEWLTEDGVPVLADAQAVFICDLNQRTEYETHGVIIARIKKLQFSSELAPLIYVGGELHTCVGELY